MDITYIIIVLVVILFSMTLHEMMHTFTSYWLGDDTAKLQGRLSLNPLKHIDPFLTIILPVFLAIVGAPIFGGAKPVPFDPTRVRGGEWGAALVAVAGPLTNLVLAFIFFGIGVFAGLITPEGVQVSLLGTIIITAISVNIGFFAFNVIPVPPLDGSRVLYALAPEFIRRFMESAERAGLFIVFAIVILFNEQLGQVIYAIMNAVMKAFSLIFGL